MMTSFLFAVALSFLTDDADFPQTSALSVKPASYKKSLHEIYVN